MRIDQDVREFCQIDSSSGTSFEPVYSKDLLELREEFIENVEDRLSDEFFADFYDNTNLFEQTPTPNDHLLIKTNPIKDDFESLLSKKSGLQYKIMRLVYQHEHGKVIKTLPVNALTFLNHEDLKFEELYSGNYRFTGIEYWDKENKIWVFEELINHNEQSYQMQVVFNNNITVHDLISKVYFDAHFNKPQEESTSQSLTLSLNPNFNNINKDESIEIKLMNLNDRENIVSLNAKLNDNHQVVFDFSNQLIENTRYLILELKVNHQQTYKTIGSQFDDNTLKFMKSIYFYVPKYKYDWNKHFYEDVVIQDYRFNQNDIEGIKNSSYHNRPYVKVGILEVDGIVERKSKALNNEKTLITHYFNSDKSIRDNHANTVASFITGLTGINEKVHLYSLDINAKDETSENSHIKIWKELDWLIQNDVKIINHSYGWSPNDFLNIGFYNFINGKEINDDKDFKRELKKYIDTLNKDDIVNNTINKYKFKNYIYDFISYYFDIINIFSAGNSYNDEIRYRNKNGHILEINWFDISKYSFLNDVKNKYEDLLMPFLVAPGEGIYDTSIITKFIKNKGDKNINLGTSFSAPIVTGAISLLQSYYMVNNANKTIPLTHIRSILAASSIPLKNNENYDFYKNSFSHLYGAGHLDFKRAIEAYKNAKQTKILTKHKDKQLVKEMDISIDNDQTNFNFALSWLFKPTSNSFSKKHDYNSVYNEYKKLTYFKNDNYDIYLVKNEDLKNIDYQNFDNFGEILRTINIYRSESDSNVELIRAPNLNKGEYKILVYQKGEVRNEQTSFSYTFIKEKAIH